VGGTSDSYSLSVAAAAHAAVGTTNFTLTGAPSSVAVGPQKHTAKGSFTVVQPFTMVVGGGYGSTVALAPCTPAAPLVVELLPSQGLPADTVATITCTGLPPSVICVILQPTVTLSASVSVTLVFSTFQQPAGSAPIPFTVTASIPGFTQTIKGELVVAHTAITSISPFVTTPRAGNPGSTLLISGQGFCQGTRVRFGNDLAMAIPTQITPTLIQVETPRLATTGSLATTGWAGKTPFGIITPDGVAVSGPANWLTQVDSYRNTYGWPFHNYDVNELTFDQLTELYGQNATYINTPFGNVRNPWASIYLATVKAALDGNDLCFGTVLATQRIKNNQWGAVNIGDMPSDNSQFHLPFTWLNPNLTSPNNTPAPQDDFIHVQHIAQYSDEFLGYYLNNSLFATPQSAGTWRTVIEQTFAGNNFPLVCMRKNAGDGHVVVAYDIEENPADPSGYIIDVYDPNEEFTNGEDGDGSGVAHQLAFQLSQILVGGDGSWWFPEDADSWPPPSGTTWSGDVHSIIVCPTQVIPPIPSMPGIASAIWYALEGGAVAVFGSGGATPALREHVTTTAGISTAQLSDSAGRILFLADGSLNTDPATRVAAAPFAVTTGTKGRGDTFVIRPGGAYSHTVRGKSTGSYGIMVVGRKFGVVLTCETVEGQQDTIMLDTGGRAFTFSTGAESAALRAEVMMSGPNGSPHFATLLTRAGSATTHTLRFSADGASVIHDHRGDAAPFEIYLSALNRQGLRHATTSGPLASQDGQTTTLTPADWHDLKAVMLQQTGATTRILTAAPLVASES